LLLQYHEKQSLIFFFPFGYYIFSNLQALPEDLKSKLSIDEELVASPKQSFSGISTPKPAAKPKYSKR
jgi:hypothetical protein